MSAETDEPTPEEIVRTLAENQRALMEQYERLLEAVKALEARDDSAEAVAEQVAEEFHDALSAPAGNDSEDRTPDGRMFQ